MSKLHGDGISILVVLAAFASLGIFGQSGPSKPAAVPMATYSDPAGDVSFDYPVVWKIDNSPQFYIPPVILQGDRKPRVQVVFSTAGNLYEKTTLHSLVFIYVKTPQPSQEVCAAMAVSPMPDTVDTVVINGVPFQHFEIKDAAMGHGVKQEVFRGYRDGMCYLFEGDMDTTCIGAVDGQRALTTVETRVLMRHLNAIPQSIRFAAQ